MKTTELHFAKFKSYFEEYIKEFQLTGWCVVYQWSDLKDRYAEIHIDLNSMNATVAFCTDWGCDDIVPLTDEQVKESAEHEALHLLIGELTVLGKSRYIDQNIYQKAEHDLIHRLQNLLKQ